MPAATPPTEAKLQPATRESAPAPLPRITATRLARRLALAYAIEGFIESGEIKNFAEASRRFGVSRPRVTQIMSLQTLPAPIQEAILIGTITLSERKVLQKYAEAGWDSGGSQSKLPISA